MLRKLLRFKRPTWSRNLRADDYLELMFVAAAATVVIVRLYLSLTGYPQVGSSRLHIAHVLWGGGLMLLAMVMMISYLSAQAWRYASILGGIGFGLFIDEIGKYLTKDNNYFFRPAVSLIYVVLMAMFLVSRFIGKATELTPLEQQLNQLVDDGAGGGRISTRARALYNRLAHTVWASRILAFLLAAQVLALLGDCIYIFGSIHYHHDVVYRFGIIASLLSLVLTIGGIVLLKRTTKWGYRVIQLGVLTDLFFIQLFSFYQNQLWALITLILNVVIYAAIRYSEHHEAPQLPVRL